MTIVRHIKSIIIVSFIVFVSLGIWVNATLQAGIALDLMWGQILGAIIIVLFSIVFLLSTKWHWVTKTFGGLENVYFAHRWSALIAFGLIFLHAEITIDLARALPFDFDWLIEAEEAGELSRNLFLLLIFIIPLNKIIKYENWKIIHRFMIVPFIIGVYHAYFTSSIHLLQMDLISLWMGFIVLLGSFSGIYIILIYPWKSFKYKGKIKEVTRLNDHVINIQIELNKKYQYESGQFAFLRIHDKAIEDEIHPFSISGGDGYMIEFTIKTLGDYTTSLFNHLQPSMKVQLSSPYGELTFNQGRKKQLWVAGGVGITPFLSHIRNQQTLSNDITLIYNVREEKDALYLDYFKEYALMDPNFKFKLHVTSKEGHLDLSHVDISSDDSVFLCGPQGMVQNTSNGLKKLHAGIDVHQEAFDFMGDIVNMISTLIHKLHGQILMYYKKIKTGLK